MLNNPAFPEEKFEKENADFKSQTEKLIAEAKAKAEKIAELEKMTFIYTAKNRMAELSKPLNLTEIERSFIEKLFKPEKMADLTDDGIKKFIDDTRETYKTYAAVTTPAAKLPGEKSTDEDKDYTKPENNDLI
jgi:hypothetical protein